MPTGYVFEQSFTEHDYPGHPECAARLTAIMNYLTRNDIYPQLTKIKARAATKEELLLGHDEGHIKMVEKVSKQGGGMLDADTYSNIHSYQAAVEAVGGLIELTNAVISDKLDNGFALVRPPGHHAVRHRAMGFCLFSNVALAARVAQQQHPEIERVAIVDFDVHHGNGTQDILNTDPSILFVSSHQFPFYPGTGNLSAIGAEEGKGATINLPLPAGVGDQGILKLYEGVVYPAIRRFKPQLIFVSAGFDAHWSDPLAGIQLTLTGLHWLCQSLTDLAQEICEGRIVFTLEGGYNLEALSIGVGNAFRILLGDVTTIDDSMGPSYRPGASVDRLFNQLVKLHNVEA